MTQRYLIQVVAFFLCLSFFASSVWATSYAFLENRVFVYDVETKTYTVFPLDINPVVSPDGIHYVTRHSRGKGRQFILTLWNSETQTSTPIGDGPLPGYCGRIILSPDSKTIAVSATCAFEGTPFAVYSLETGKRIDHIDTPEKVFKVHARFLPDHADLILSDQFQDDTFRTKRVDLLANARRWEKDGNVVALSNDGMVIVLADISKNRIVVCDTNTGAVRWEHEGIDARFDPEEKKIIVTQGADSPKKKGLKFLSAPLAETKHALVILDADTGRVIRETTFPSKIVQISPDADYVLTATKKAATLYEMKTGKEIRNIKGHVSDDGMIHANFSRTGKYCLSTVGRTSDPMRIYETATGKELRTIRAPIFDAAFTKDDAFLVTEEGDVIDMASDLPVFRSKDVPNPEGNTWRVARFNNDGSKIYFHAFRMEMISTSGRR